MDSITPANIDKPAALAARYGAAVPAAGPWNDVIASLMTHRSVRGFLAAPVPAGTLETLVAAAQSASTSSNLQTWSVVAVHDPAKRKELVRIANNQKHIEVCPLFLVWVADVSRNERLATEEGATLEGLPYLETFLVSAIDAALAAQNATIAAESLGLSMVYIGALRNDPEGVAKLLNLPKGAMAVFGMCVGYATPAGAGEVKPRLSQRAILHHDVYDAAAERTLRADYDKEMADFSKRQKMPAGDWSGRVIDRMGTIPALSGREKLKEQINALGFPLK